MPKREVVVIGAGVIGLTVSNRLQESGAFDVTIVAEHIPQHKSVGQRESTGWASPWAGAHWRAWAGDKDTLLQDMELETYREMQRLARTAPESGISEAEGVDLFEDKPANGLWYATKVDDVQELRKSELPEGVAYGLKYSTLLINVPQYLSYLKAQFEGLGGRVIQGRLDHIREALLFVQTRKDPPLVINCTALGSRSLGGVNDQNMYPIRGQTLVVDAPLAKRTLTRIGKVFGYVIPRGDGTVVIGGTADRGSWDASAHDETTQAILEKALALEPDLVPGNSGLSFEQRTELLRQSIVSVNVGFRPARVGGVRLEAEDFAGAFTAIHCYGHAGFGYQSNNNRTQAYTGSTIDTVACRGAFVSNDEVIDGISPIRRDGPLENLVEGDEDGLASRHNGRALEFGPVKRKRADSSELVDADKVLDASVEGTASTTAERNASSDDSRFAEEPVDSEESDSDVFDIDKLVAENTTTATPRPTRSRRTNVASRMAAGELTTRDWLEEPSVGGQLPKRHRTQQQTKTPTKKPGKKAAANDRKQRLAVNADGSEESAHEPDEPWRSEKPAARSSRTRAAAKTKDAIKTGTRTTYGKKRATATQHQPQAELWNPESALTTHFDEIDGYELAEETV
ncbi:hypothetical protein EC988_002907 [Linderina pennispora]|nr:hypothetical protein EC988_002907 [Linderina pennispora]